MPRRALVAVVGNARVEPGGVRERLAEAIGEGLVDAGHRVVTGGLGGVMAAACRGARRSSAWRDGATIGVLPGTDPDAANAWVDIAMCTGLDHGRNRVVAQSDAVIAIGGGAGTLSEMAFAWIHQRLVIALRCGGWSERLADERVDERIRFPEIAEDRVFGADDAAAALRVLTEWLPHYSRRITRPTQG
ncbi:MAG: TIGR00725 family protein [Myxococcota bacterium]